MLWLDPAMDYSGLSNRQIEVVIFVHKNFCHPQGAQFQFVDVNHSLGKLVSFHLEGQGDSGNPINIRDPLEGQQGNHLDY